MTLPDLNRLTGPQSGEPDGYEFIGWYTASVAGTLVDEETLNEVVGDRTLYARWALKVSTVSFDLNGATGATPRDAAWTYGTFLTFPSEPTRAGYTFDGWFTAEEGGEEITSLTANADGAAETTLYAQWVPVEYAITYDFNYANSERSIDSWTYGTAFTVAEDPIRSGYVFDGWFNAAVGGTVVTSYAAPRDTTLYAHWSIGTYLVTWVNEGTTVQSNSVSVLTGLPSAPALTRTAYTLTWDRSADYATMTITAIWTPTPNYYTVSYNLNGGDGDSVADQGYSIVESLILPTAAPARTGYHFDGWYTSATGGTLVSNGAPASTRTLYAHWSPLPTLVSDINAQGDSTPYFFTALGNYLYFAAGNGAEGADNELWRTNGSTTTLFADINVGEDGSWPGDLTLFNGYIYFSADDGIHGLELWRTDGTTTTLVEDINEGADTSAPYELTVLGGHLYFVADDGVHGFEVWRTDGSTTELVHDINTTGYLGAVGSDPRSLTTLGAYLYFTADDGVHGNELWRTTGEVTTLVEDINTANDGFDSSSAYGFTALAGYLYFSADDGVHGTELWRTNGTTTELVLDINPDSTVSNPGNFTALGSYLYFRANGGEEGTELWRTNGTTTELVQDINAGADGSWAGDFTLFGDYLYFSATDATHGSELWRTNGTTTELVQDINPGAGPSNPYSYTVLGDYLYFQAYSPATGLELWRTDGVTTTLLHDINPGAADSGASGFTLLNGYLYFMANDGVNGMELWRLN